MKNEVKKDIKNIICIIIIAFMGLILLHDICSTSIFGHSPYDSYEKQADAWLHGRTYLDRNYTHLELAIFEGRYYVSFPPLPSVIMLPFVIVFGANVPNNLIIAIICILTSVLAYKILRRAGTNDIIAMLFALFYVFGSNMLAVSLAGGVWWIAQALNLLFCTIAVDAFLKNKRMAAYTALALAVGCRPLSAVYIVALFIYWLVKDLKDNTDLVKTAKKLIVDLIPLIIIALAYMAYNYIRFRNPLEFGHNYLPEFTESQYGQFSLHYLLPNLKQLFFEPISFDSQLNLSFTKFNGFWFYIANPIFLLAAYRAVKDIIKKKSISVLRAILFGAMLLNIVMLCCHKTLGGWQFGARYTCDMMAFALMSLIVCANEKSEDAAKEGNIYLLEKDSVCALIPDRAEIVMVAFGILFNIFGTVEFWLGLIN